jgi:hypothetical protein
MFGKPDSIGFVLLVAPFILQIFKKLTGWEGNKMLVVSLFAVYIPISLIILEWFLTTPITVETSIQFTLAVALFPLVVWFGTQGLYTEFFKVK